MRGYQYSPRSYKTQHSCDVVVSNPANKNARISSCTSWSVSLYFDSGSRALNNKVNKSFLLSASSSHWRCLMICLTRLSRTLWCWWTWNALKGCLQDQSFGNTKKAISPACLRNEFTAYNDRKRNYIQHSYTETFSVSDDNIYILNFCRTFLWIFF